MSKEISYNDYIEALRIKRLYEAQFEPKTVCVSVNYEAELRANVRVPEEMSIQEVIDDLKTGHYHREKYGEDRINLGKISELIIDGDVIDLSNV